MRRAMWGLLVGLLLCGGAWATELRTFPSGVMWAQFRGYDGEKVALGDPRPSLAILLSSLGLGGDLGDRTDVVTQSVSLPIAPGLVVRDPQNMIVSPDLMRDTGRALVRFQVDIYGAVWRIWFLTPEEAAKF